MTVRFDVGVLERRAFLSTSTFWVGEDVASNVSTKLCGAAHHGLGAVGAAAGVDGDFAEAFWALLSGGVGRLLAAVHAGDQSIDWENDEEVDDGCDQDEGDAGVDEIAN